MSSAAPRRLSFFTMGIDIPLVRPENRENIKQALEEMLRTLPTQGIDLHSFLFQEVNQAEEDRMVKELTSGGQQWDLVLIGNGVRSPPHMMTYFERLINRVHQNVSKGTKIVFNTVPTDTIAGVERWFQRHDVNGQILWTPRIDEKDTA